ncbi:hypothetical protein TRSC58_07484 [Trypanosoma rangeli SC58]|uniref:Uncharacterized protein n=1 Tax=Trypanosoma rangeli SC58 TaxID=429131 RepID=A0A061ISR2_TRYRA|nr:hypothetical protein TRSC58_07484 [Trypanosoma rangeli SC58]
MELKQARGSNYKLRPSQKRSEQRWKRERKGWYKRERRTGAVERITKQAKEKKKRKKKRKANAEEEEKEREPLLLLACLSFPCMYAAK